MKKHVLFMFAAVLAVTVNAGMPDFPFIFVEGYAKKEIPPDMAQINFYLETRSADVAEAISAMDDQSKVILKYLYDRKIEASDIIAHRIQKEALYNEGKRADVKVIGCQASRYFSITVKDISNYVDIAQTVFSNTNIVRVYTDFGVSNKSEIDAELLAQASRNAKEKAAQLAKSFGGKLGLVHAITQHNFYNIDGAFGVGPSEYSGRSLSHTVDSGFEGIAEEHRVLYVPSSITLEDGVMAIFRIETE